MRDVTKKEFKEKFRRGLGSAILALENCEDVSKYKDIVLWGCLNYMGYDRLFEGERSEYIYCAISFFKDDDYFEAKIIDKFCATLNDLNLAEQLTGLLWEFAAAGSEKARAKLYSVYEELFDLVKGQKSESRRCVLKRESFERMCGKLVSLDGFEVFLRIVNDLGDFFKSNPGKDPFHFDWFCESSKDKLGKKRVERVLEKNNIKYDWRASLRKPVEEKEFTAEEVIEDCKKHWWKSNHYALHLLRKGDPDEVSMLINAVIAEPDLNVKANMLKVFTWGDVFPGDINHLIDYTKSENRKLCFAAFSALTDIESDRAHDYAIELLTEKKYEGEAISILCRNYRKSDYKILEDSIKKLTLEDEHWHMPFSDFCFLAEENKHAPKEALRYIYEKTLCSYCRENVVRVMNKRRMIGVEMLKELEKDSNYDISRFAYRKLKKLNVKD